MSEPMKLGPEWVRPSEVVNPTEEERWALDLFNAQDNPGALAMAFDVRIGAFGVLIKRIPVTTDEPQVKNGYIDD